MKKVVFLSLLLTFAAGFLACKDSAKEEPRRDDGMKNTYYIEGVTLTPELLASTTMEISELGKAPTVANIATRLHSAPGQLQTIKSDGDQLTIITYPGE